MPGFVGLNPPATIEDGTVNGDRVAFKTGTTTYTGVLKGDQIELERGMPSFGLDRHGAPATPTGPRPAIGPPPDGADPSTAFVGRSRGQLAPVLLRRVSR